MAEPIHIALSFDDNYWAPAFAAMRSVCLSTKRRADLVFHLLQWRLSPEHRDELDDINREFGAQVIHYPLEADEELGGLIAILPSTRAYPPITYGPLLLDKLLPAEVTKLVYLDADVMVRAPIERLLAIDLANRPIGAVPEPGRQGLIGGEDMRMRHSPFDSADDYFNAGVLVIDRARWAAAGLSSIVLELRDTNELKTLHHVQDILNLALRDNWLALDRRWNLTRPHPALYALDPFIVHYTSGQKPWNMIAYVAFAATYRQVMTKDLLQRYRAYRWQRRWERLFDASKHNDE